MRALRFVTILTVALMMIGLSWGCGARRLVPQSGAMQGRAMVNAMLPIPDAGSPSLRLQGGGTLRQAILLNWEAIEAAGPGHTVAGDGSSVTWPPIIPAGWIARLGNQQAIIDENGNFSFASIAGAPAQGQIFTPYDSTRPVGFFNSSQLVAMGGNPQTIMLELTLQGPCCMTRGFDVAGCNCTETLLSTVNRPARGGSRAQTRRQGQLGDFTFTVGALGTYPSQADGSACGQLNGIQVNNALGFEAAISYFGST